MIRAVAVVTMVVLVDCQPGKVTCLVSKMKSLVRSAAQWVVVVMVARLLLRTVYRTRQQTALIPQATPSQVWQFMADFSNYKLLNPHLIDWQVISDSAHKKKQVTCGPTVLLIFRPDDLLRQLTSDM